MILSLLKSTIEVGVGVIVSVGVSLGTNVGLGEGMGVLDGSGVGMMVSLGSGEALGAFDKGAPPLLHAARTIDVNNRIDKRMVRRYLNM